MNKTLEQVARENCVIIHDCGDYYRAEAMYHRKFAGLGIHEQIYPKTQWRELVWSIKQGVEICWDSNCDWCLGEDAGLD